MQGSVSLHIDAPPEKVWGLVSDITNTGRFSPETFEAEWLEGASEPAVGVKFRGHVLRNGRPPAYWTVCKITDCEPGETFGFAVLGPGERVVNNWRYDFEPDGDGTKATESFRLESSLPTKIYWALLGRLRGKTNERGMRETLGRIKEAAEE
ncbi:MAG: SRPBCC family protein [Microthrixaceae bacterium]